MKESFMSIADTRQQSQVRHELYEIIAMTIAAVIGNCDGWDEIEDFCHSKEAWLREHMGLKLEHGIPSETTFARVWGRIDPDAFKRCFSQWTNRIREKLPGEVINIDGKTACGSRSTRRKAIHMISAWATEQELVLRQMCVAEKTNEISSVPLLLELLDVSGCIVTADAMNCQREIAKKISPLSMNTRKLISEMLWSIRNGIRKCVRVKLWIRGMAELKRGRIIFLQSYPGWKKLRIGQDWRV